MKRYCFPDICVCCGAPVWEGRQVCLCCEKDGGPFPLFSKEDSPRKARRRRWLARRLRHGDGSARNTNEKYSQM
jgi:hypothetical protein